MIRGALALVLALCAAVPARASEPAPAQTTAPGWANWSDRGLEIGFRLAGLSVFNGEPLAYSPIEFGYRFGGGLRARTGVQLFYYEGEDTDAKQPLLGVRKYSYEMLDWRSSLEYAVPLPSRLRPVVGIGLDVVSGSRSLADRTQPSPPKLSAWSVVAPGALLGAEWRGGEHWSVELNGRYVHGFTETGPIASGELGWHYLF